MTSEGLRDEELCPECGKLMDIYNGDIQFSLELHLQSHKSLEAINHEIEKWLQPINYNLDYVSRHESKEIVLENDVLLTLDQHTVKDNSVSIDVQSVGQSTKSEVKMKKMLIDTETNSNSLSAPVDILTDIFSSLPSELKAHQSFMNENKNGNLVCKICKVTVEPISSVTGHLKTRLHEDRTIQYFKDTLSNEFHHIMEFVSFNNSNLCCNLCRFSYDLCPNNPNKTIFSIMKHNLSIEHIEKNTINKSWSFSDLGSVIIRSLSQFNQTIDDNQHCLEFKLQPEFRCKLCNVVVGCDLNETSLYKLFINHFMSETHLNTRAASELETYNALNISSKQTHHFTIEKNNIYCSVCKSYVEPNVQALTYHVTQIPSSDIPDSVTSVENNQTQSFLTSIEKNQSTNIFKTSDDQRTSPGIDSQGNSGNPKCLIDPVPQQSNITHSVDEPNVHALTCDKNQVPSSEIPDNVTSVKNNQTQSFVTPIEKNPTKNILKTCDDLSEGYSGNPKCLIDPVTQQSNTTHSVDEPNVHVLTCDKNQMPSSEIPDNVTSVKNNQTQAFLTSIEKNPTKNISKTCDDPRGIDSQGKYSGNHKYLIDTVPQQSNTTHSVDDPNVQAIKCDKKHIPSSVIPHTVSSVENTQAQSFLTSIEKTQLTTNYLEKSDDPSTLPGRNLQGNPSKNPEMLPNPEPQQSNIIHSVDEPNVQKSTCDVKPSPSAVPSVTLTNNGVPYSIGSKQPEYFPVSTEKKVPPSNHTMQSPDLQQSKSEIILRILKSLPQKLKNSQCIVQNEQNKLMCSICNCEIPLSLYNVKSHLLGKPHADCFEQFSKSDIKINSVALENRSTMLNYSEQLSKPLTEVFPFMETRPNKKLHCLICNLNIPHHINCLNEHVNGSYHKMSKKQYNVLKVQ